MKSGDPYVPKTPRQTPHARLDSSDEEPSSAQWATVEADIALTPYQKNNLPKANDIVDTSDDIKKVVYPFKMDPVILQQKCDTAHTSYLKKRELDSTSKFNSSINNNPKKTINLTEIFVKKNVIYDRYGCGIQGFPYLSIFSLEKIRKIQGEETSMLSRKTPQDNQPRYRLQSETDDLVFDSRFESGNLAFVAKDTEKNEYNLLLQNDTNTSGYNNWFYFKVSNKEANTQQIKKSHEPSRIGTNMYRKIYRFNILNLGKVGQMFNNGMGVLTYSKKYNQEKGMGWYRQQSSLNCYSKNNIFIDPEGRRDLHTLSFDLEFRYPNDDIFVAYSIPYTYTDLCNYIGNLENNFSKSGCFHRKLMGRTLLGNRLELLTITTPHSNGQETDKPVIIVLARHHPGETVSSWVLKGLIESILGSSKEAQDLRRRFVFKVIPMLNPDGVIHGNYRCSLAGRDLNRRWKKPDRNLHPQIYYAKKHILQIASKRKIGLILDLHGHSRKKNMFMYGCNDRNNPLKCREFPYLLSKLNPNFEYRACNFMIEKYKEATARVSLFRQLHLAAVYTLEVSMCGSNNQHWSLQSFKEMGKTLSQAISVYFNNHHIERKLNSPRGKDEEDVKDANPQLRKLIGSLWENPELQNVGNNRGEDSQSEPSVDNIPHSQLQKLVKIKEKHKNGLLLGRKAGTSREMSLAKGLSNTAAFERSYSSKYKSYLKADLKDLSATKPQTRRSSSKKELLLSPPVQQPLQESKSKILTKPMSAGLRFRNSNPKMPKPVILRQEYRFSNKTIVPFQEKVSKEIRLINFPMMLHTMEDYDQTSAKNGSSGGAVVHESLKREEPKPGNNINSSSNTSRFRTFLRLNKSKMRRQI